MAQTSRSCVAEARWRSGVWVGRKWSTPHHLVSLGNRVVDCRAIQSVPLADRWKSELVEAVRATRWTNPAPVAGASAPAVLSGPAEPPRAQKEVSIYVLMTFGGLVVRQGAADVH